MHKRKVSTRGKSWSPFKGNPKITRRNAKLWRLMKAGKVRPLTKAEMRYLAANVPPVTNPDKTPG
jgi:hypothetical protein